MKLKRLQIQKFVGIPHAIIDLDAPIVAVLGGNNAGKSSVRDAILFALTGKARGLITFKAVGTLATNAVAEQPLADDMKVQLEYEQDGQVGTIVRTVKTASQNVEHYNSMIPYCLRPLDFLELSESERGAILSQTLGDSRSLTQEALAANGLWPAPFGLNVLLGIDNIRDAVITMRREAKAKLAEAERQKPPAKPAMLPADYTDPAGDRKDIVELSSRLKKGEKLILDCDRQNQRDVQILACKKAIKDLEAKTVCRIPAMQQKVLEVLRDFINEFDRQKVAALPCPICGRETYLNEAVQLSKELEVNSKAAAEAMKIANELKFQNQHLEQLTKEAESAPRIDTPKNTTGLFAKLTEDRSLTQRRVDAWDEYQAALSATADLQPRKDSLQATIKECDRIDKLLADGGSVKAYIIEHGKQLPISKDLLVAWGLDTLEIKTSGQILLHARPIELASTSEFYRAAAIIGIALAEVCNVGFAALDGADILTADLLNAAIPAILDSGIQTIILKTNLKKPDGNDNEDVKVYWVENGEIGEL